MRKPKSEEEIVAAQPVDKIDKNLRHIFGLLVEKDWKMAQNLITLMKGGNAEAQQLAEGFTELVDFLKVFSAGKEMKAAMRALDSLLLNNDLENLFPRLDEEDFDKLKSDIASKGILAPLIVQDTPDGLLLVDGYTRYRIAGELGLKRVPVVSVTPMMDARIIAIAVNLMRRHVSKQTRDDLIESLPIPKVGRPKKGEKVISAKVLAKELGISDRTIERARSPKYRQNDQNVGISKSKLRRVAAQKGEKAPEFRWISTKDLEIFREVGYLKGLGYYFDFTKDQIDLDLLVRQVDTGMQQLLKAMKDAGLEDQVEKYRMMITFECRKRGVDENAE